MSTRYTESLYQALCDMVEVMRLHGVVNVVLSPGSRSAPLALSFMRNGKFDVYHIVDERSAGYFGLGLAKATMRPTVLVCTSGTATYNYAPAVAEAYFQEIPLLVLTSDRPQEWIGQNDNQAIFQQQLFGEHALQFHQMPHSYEAAEDRSFAIQKVNEACLKSQGLKKGPVHLNFPFREPFYPEGPIPEPSSDLRVVRTETSHVGLSKMLVHDVLTTIASSKNIWILAGMSASKMDAQPIADFVARTGAIACIDPLANMEMESSVNNYDHWLKTTVEEKPDLVISFGNHFLSKSLKQFVRNNKPKNHIHIQEHDVLADPFGSIQFLVQSKLSYFFKQLNEFLPVPQTLPANPFLEMEQVVEGELDAELLAAKALIEALPEDCVLHMGNSTPVRYLLRWQHLLKNKGIEVFANRGTSGIDGSVSTAVGMSQGDSRKHVLIIGDLSMYYDRNGLWNNYLNGGFSIVVMNNQGGGIFKRINGPKQQSELEAYFVNQQPTDFQSMALEHGFTYQLLSAKEVGSDAFTQKLEGAFLGQMFTEVRL